MAQLARAYGVALGVGDDKVGTLNPLPNHPGEGEGVGFGAIPNPLNMSGAPRKLNALTASSANPDWFNVKGPMDSVT